MKKSMYSTINFVAVDGEATSKGYNDGCLRWTHGRHFSQYQATTAYKKKIEGWKAQQLKGFDTFLTDNVESDQRSIDQIRKELKRQQNKSGDFRNTIQEGVS